MRAIATFTSPPPQLLLSSFKASSFLLYSRFFFLTRSFSKRTFANASSSTSNFTSSCSLPSLAHLESRCVLSIQGEKAPQFIQNLITNQIHALESPSCPAIYTAFLSAQGRYLCDGFISCHPTSSCTYLLDIHRSHVSHLSSHLRRYNVRGEILIEDAHLDVWFSWHSLPFNANNKPTSSTLLAYEDPRIKNFGARYLMDRHTQPYPSSLVSLLHENDYTLYRYKHGVPESTDFVPNVSLPLEVNFDLLNAVDFHKGCYLGQELTIRTHHTGVVRKRIVPLTVFSASEGSCLVLPSMTDLVTEDGRKAGKVYGWQGTCGLGLLRLQYVHQTLHVHDQPLLHLVASKPDWWPKEKTLELK